MSATVTRLLPGARSIVTLVDSPATIKLIQRELLASKDDLHPDRGQGRDRLVDGEQHRDWPHPLPPDRNHHQATRCSRLDDRRAEEVGMKHRLAIRQGATPKRLLTAAEAAVTHKPGDRYVKSDGTMVRLHIPKAANAPQAHFEEEPRWMV